MARPAADVEAAGVGRYQVPLMVLVGGGFFTATVHLATTAALSKGLAASFPAMADATLVARTLRGATQAAVMAGAAVGGLLQGAAADRLGRLPVFRGAMAAAALGAIFVCLSPHVAVFLAARIVLGLALGAALVVDFVLLAEFLPASSRGGNTALVVAAGIAAFFYAALCVRAVELLVSSLSASWRVLVAALSLPSVVCAAGRFAWWRDESPFFLHRAGRDADYAAVVARMHAANGTSFPTQRSVSPVIVASPSQPAPALPVGLTAAVAALYVLQTVGYYGLVLWLAEIGQAAVETQPSVALTYVLIGVSEAAGLAAAAAMIDRGGRRSVLLLGFALSSAATALLLLVPAGCAALFYGLYALAFFGVILVWTALYVAAPELFPTAVRARATGVANAAGKAAGVLSPLALALLAGSRALIAVIGAAFGAAALLVLLAVPETSRSALY